MIHCGTRALADPQDLQAMSELMWAGSLSHNGLTGLGAPKDFAVHQLAMSSAPASTSPMGPPSPPCGAAGRSTAWRPTPPALAQYGVSVWGLDPAGGSQEELARQAIAALWTTSDPWDAHLLTELAAGFRARRN